VHEELVGDAPLRRRLNRPWNHWDVKWVERGSIPDVGGSRTKLWLGLVKVAPKLLGRCERTIGWSAEHLGLLRLPGDAFDLGNGDLSPGAGTDRSIARHERLMDGQSPLVWLVREQL
jgi:hypothetical protein